MFRADRVEVATIGGEDRGDRAPLGDGDDARIRSAEWDVSALVDELGHALEVVLDEVGDDEVAVSERSEEGGLGCRAEVVPADHVADFGDDGRRYEERSGQGLQQPRALLVPYVGVVEAGDERAGIDEDFTQLGGPFRFGRRP